MKNSKWIFVLVLIVTIFAGLFYRYNIKNNGFEKTEFLFDTQCTITAYGKDAKTAVNAAFDCLAEIHNTTNYYSENSQVTKINNAAAGDEIFIGEEMKKILTATLDVSGSSYGAFDITIAPIMELWNFSDGGNVPKHQEIQQRLALVGADKLSYDGKSKLTKTADGVKIDLGGAAKGYAGDVAIEILKGYNVSGAVVDLGGNITCFGKNPNNKNGKWRIGLQKPFAPAGEYNDVIEIEEGAVVTSGIYQRYFENEGKRYHHIINPQTGYPADMDYSSVTIVADSSLYADCLATACYILGKDKGKDLADKYSAEIYFAETIDN